MRKYKLIVRFVPKKYRKMVYFIISAILASGLFIGNVEVLELLRALSTIFSF